jgi:predicted MPP superfamily phosphohydrolase
LHVLADLLRELRGTKANVVASLGNWEHWGKIAREDLRKTYRDAGATLLVNESLALADGVQVFATDDSTSGRPEFKMGAQRPGQPQILRTHSPELLDRCPTDAAPMAVSLSGHTHGGQVRLGSRFVPFLPQGSGRFVAGWYRTAAGRAYVSRGTGTSILPIRFTCRPELPVFRLRQG